MTPEVLDLKGTDDPRDVVHRVVERLAQGGLVALPTETVYAIAASAMVPAAVDRLLQVHCDTVSVRAGDGYQGWPEAAPFDAILVTAAAPRIPEPLKQQLKDGGRLVVPVGDDWQELVVLTRRGDRFEEKRVMPVRFVPMTGKVRQ